MYLLGSNCPFTQDSYTVADLVLREHLQAADAHDGSEQAHIPAKIGYTTPRDAIVGAPERRAVRCLFVVRRVQRPPGQPLAFAGLHQFPARRPALHGSSSTTDCGVGGRRSVGTWP